MPENYIAMYDAPDESLAIRIIENSNPIISKISEIIREGKTFTDRQSKIIDCLKSSVINVQCKREDSYVEPYHK